MNQSDETLPTETQTTATDGSESTHAFPTAVVRNRSEKMLASSRFWWLAVACLLIAIGLVLWSMPSGGTHIQIHFPKGHGLKAEDAVRYRGIDVGVVESILLTDDLDAVDVHVQLFPTAKRLASEGTKFWIVRPQLSITGVSGLETAVGHKYIQVQPGPADQPSTRYFDGLPSEPVDQGAGSGIEILLQADSRHSVSKGSAIHYRGVDIGRILSVELSPDARRVEVRGKIEEAYRSLVTTEAKFWATGGVDFDFSLTQGLKLETESLDTLARGGVSMLVVGSGAQVSPGHVYPLSASSDEQWIAQANDFRATSAKLRGAINLVTTWQATGMLGLGKRNLSEQFSGVGMKVNGRPMVILPSDVMNNAANALEDSFEIKVADTETVLDAKPMSDAEADATDASTDAVLLVANLPVESADGLIESSEIVTAAEPTNWIAVRRSADSNVYHHLPLDVANIKKVQPEQDDDNQSAHWTVSEFTGDRAVWHGTPVLQSADSRLVGILLIDDRGATIHPVPLEGIAK